MEREEYLKCLSIMAELEGQWYKDNDGSYKFYHPEKMTSEAIRAAKILTENDKKADATWDKFIQMNGNDLSFEDEYDDEDWLNKSWENNYV